MTQSLIILMAQINPTVGAIESNTDNIIQIISTHQTKHDVIVFPELALCGYPPEDLLFYPAIHDRISKALQRVAQATLNCHIVLGHPQIVNDKCYNSASILYQQKVITQYHKQQLPNYGVFDEKRYFSTPSIPQPCILDINGYNIGIGICEDLWQGNTIDTLIQANIDIAIIINASPFDYTKPALREALLKQKAQQGIIMVYVNMVGGQDELVFDGQSMVMNPQGTLSVRAPAFEESLLTVTIEGQNITESLAPPLENTAMIYQALVMGLREYVHKNHIKGVLLGLSGGIDSALTLAIAVDALGRDRVTAVMLPSQFTADISTLDALEQITTLGVTSHTLPIEPIHQLLLKSIVPALHSPLNGIAGENIQARIRGTLLMALSNQTGNMLISTSNKSETAVGYTTLYGDMCGGYAVLKDVLKTMVYELAHYRNQSSTVIPKRVLTRPPSAELSANQTDQDTLPDYAILDAIIQGHMEDRLSQEQLVALGYPIDAVIQTLTLIKKNEYKRHQAPLGTKITPCAFGKDWRFPITQGKERT